MRILIVYPAVSGLKNGNLVTAERWQKQFLELGHTVEIAASFDDADQGSNAEIDLMVALHATKSAASIEKCRAAKSGCQIFVVLTGTDIYDPESRSKVQQSLTMADQIVVLQTATAEDVPTEHREKVNVIFQSSLFCSQHLSITRRRCIDPLKAVCRYAVLHAPNTFYRS